MRAFLLLGAMWLTAAGPAAAADAFRLTDGDRVALLGNTLVEREQRYGYWETALTARYPNRNILFRNLGWSGDTVFGHARASFGTVAEGFQQLQKAIEAVKPTVIVVAYGTNESFDGPAGLPRFEQGLKVLLDTLAKTKARVVLLSPLRQEDMGRPLPDPTAANTNLALYRDALRKTADARGYPFVDLYDLLGDGGKAKPPAPLTDNGIHPTAFGYWWSAAVLERGLGLPIPRWHIDFDAARKTATAKGAAVVPDQASPLRFRVTDAALPPPPPPPDAPAGAALPGVERVLRVSGLAPGKYALHVDGKPVLTATAAQWAAGVTLQRGPEIEQAERLRAAIVAKNRLFFHRWRPENETYLFGFRKHEQGQNAREIPQFDPLVADQEAVIAKLRVPVAHTYELVPQTEKDR